MQFTANRRPFPSWLGPFSPARGRRSGFRINRGELGTWVEDDEDLEFWSAERTEGAVKLAETIRREWSGGRVLMLPNGIVIKPLQTDSEVGRRVVVGRFEGQLVLIKPSGERFDMARPGTVRPGDPWPGPRTTGLECKIGEDGSLRCTWYHPTYEGREEVTRRLRPADRALFVGFQKARPGVTSGRVRLTIHGHVITNAEMRDGSWQPRYVGYVDPASVQGCQN